MAEEEIALSVKILAEGAGQSIGDLRQQFRELNEELSTVDKGTAAYTNTLKAMGVVKGDLDDLRQKINALNPERQFAAIAKIGSTVASGFAAAQAASALFGSESEDLMKVLVKVQAATALASGLQGLVGFQKALTTAGIAMKAFAMSNPFTAIAVGVVALVAAVYGLVKAFDDTQEKVDSLTKANELLADSYKNIAGESDLSIPRLIANNATAQEIFDAQEKRRQDELTNLRQRLKNLQDIWDSEKDFTQEQSDEFDRINAEIILKEKEIPIAKLEFNKKTNDEIAKDNKDAKKEREEEFKKELSDLDKQIDEAKNKYQKDAANFIKAFEQKSEAWNKFYNNNLQLILDNDLKEATLKENKKSIEDAEYQIRIEELSQRFLSENLSEEQKNRARELLEKEHQNNLTKIDSESAEERAEKKRQIEDNYFNALHGISDIFFMGALKRAQGNEAKELEIKKRQFKVDKAFQVARTIIDTSRAIVGALGMVPYTPANIALSVSMGVVGAVQIAKILATQFAGEAGGGGGTPSPGGGGAPSLESPQAQQQAVTATQTQTNTQGDFTGFKGQDGAEAKPIRAYVVETDVSESQKRVRGIEERATF